MVELLDDATLVVANAHFYSVERFSLDGTRVGRTGRMGKGPGEYSHISSVDVCDDGRLAVVDILQRRITLLSSDLEYESEVVLDDPHEESAPYAAECLGGGEEVLVLGRWTGWPIDIPLGPHRVPVFASVLKGRGGRAITLDQVGSQDRYRQETQDGPAYFGGTTRAAEGGGSIYVTDAVLPLVRRFGRDGGLVAVINTGHARQPVRGRDIDDLIDRVVGSLEERGASDLRLAETRRFFRGYEYPDSFPALRGILVDDRRRIWVESYPVGPDAPRQWHVLAPDGAVEARVTLPPSFDLKDVGDGLLVGVSRDPLGAQIIRVFRYTPRYLEQRTSQ